MTRFSGPLLSILVAAVAALSGATSAQAAYPGSNGLVAFVRAGSIWTISPSTLVQKQLTLTGNNSTPVWSPSGRLIAFTSSRAGSEDIWVMNANGSGLRRITTASTREGDPTWSPDGKWLAFDSARGGTDVAIFKIRSTYPYGKALRLTTPVPPDPDSGQTGEDWGPSWSPAGGAILFTRLFPCGADSPECSTISRVSPSGGAVTTVITTSNEWAPDWAPKARAIAFSTDWDSANQYFGGPLNIYLAHADGSNVHRLTQDVDVENPVLNDSVAWAPSGTKLAFSRIRCVGGTCGNTEVWTIRSDGTGAKLLVKNAADPNWQPISVL